MTNNHYLTTWKELALVLLRDGGCTVNEVSGWAKRCGIPKYVLNEAVRQLALEEFDWDGIRCWRLSGKVRIHDLVPDDSPSPANKAVITSRRGTIGLWQITPWCA
jgi:hypothetical protein